MRLRTLNHRAVSKPDEVSWLYVLRCDRFHKVGLTTNPERRMAQMLLHNPMPMTVVMYRTVPRRHIRFVESEVHKALSEWHHHNEWFTAPIEKIKEAVFSAMSRSHTRERHFQKLLEKRGSVFVPQHAGDRDE